MKCNQLSLLLMFDYIKTSYMTNRLLLPAFIFLALCSCTTIADPSDSARSDETNILTIPSVGILPVKSQHTDAFLLGAFGVMLEDGSGDGRYDGTEWMNVRFTATPDGECTAERDILLSATKGFLYSYYPYSENVTDVRHIPLDITSDASADYMFGTPVNGIDKHHPKAAVIMNHALAAISISLVRGKYSGPGIITMVSVNGEGIAGKGTLDATDGTISDISDISADILLPVRQGLISNVPFDNVLMIIPTGEISPFTIRVTIDGMDFYTSAPATELAKGTVTCYKVIVNSENLELSRGSVSQWYTEDLGSFYMEFVN